LSSSASSGWMSALILALRSVERATATGRFDKLYQGGLVQQARHLHTNSIEINATLFAFRVANELIH
jgi:hypothetical protein